jgi:hypothetical protein
VRRSCRQIRSAAVTGADMLPLACAGAPDQHRRTHANLARDEEAARPTACSSRDRGAARPSSCSHSGHPCEGVSNRPNGVPSGCQAGHRVMVSETNGNGSRGRTQDTMALDQSALLEVLEALKAAEMPSRGTRPTAATCRSRSSGWRTWPLKGDRRTRQERLTPSPPHQPGPLRTPSTAAKVASAKATAPNPFSATVRARPAEPVTREPPSPSGSARMPASARAPARVARGRHKSLAAVLVLSWQQPGSATSAGRGRAPPCDSRFPRRPGRPPGRAAARTTRPAAHRRCLAGGQHQSAFPQTVAERTQDRLGGSLADHARGARHGPVHPRVQPFLHRVGVRWKPTLGDQLAGIPVQPERRACLSRHAAAASASRPPPFSIAASYRPSSGCPGTAAGPAPAIRRRAASTTTHAAMNSPAYNRQKYGPLMPHVFIPAPATFRSPSC